MKLGLLVVLVLAAVLPNLSESRIVSKCELKDKLAEAINKTRGYETTAASASYGIFQLSDGYFCDSGNHLSRNLCQKSCTGEFITPKQIKNKESTHCPPVMLLIVPFPLLRLHR
uniref:Lysozyme n=1 Tax=Poecilia mexicana TaxID=48701 RepID=A0A3B3WIS8_9TELE